MVVETPNPNLVEGMKWLLGTYNYGTELRESAETKAERMIAEAASEGLTGEHQWRKGHPARVKLAKKLREETTVSVAWIACRLEMGTREHLAHLLSKARTPLNSDQQSMLGI
jgi:hypothetical protein